MQHGLHAPLAENSAGAGGHGGPSWGIRHSGLALTPPFVKGDVETCARVSLAVNWLRGFMNEIHVAWRTC